MHRAPLLAAVALVAAPATASLAQVQRWNDRAQGDWTDDAPAVSIFIEGSRLLSYGAPVRVRFRVSDDAYVVVGRVDGEGRLTILYPQNRSSRAFTRGNVDTWVRGRRSGSFASFYAAERSGGTGFVFALASYAPLDFSAFKSGDFERIGGTTQFSLVNRRYAFRPDEYIERFASWVLFDSNTPYDYDVDYYSLDSPHFASPLSLCYSGNRQLFDYNDWSESIGWGLVNPYAGYCRNYFNSYLWCMAYSVYSHFGSCTPYYQPFVVTGPTAPPPGGVPVTPSQPGVANKKVIESGLWKPDPKGSGVDNEGRPTPLSVGETAPRAERSPTRNADDWDQLYSIPERSLRSLKQPNDERLKDASTQSTVGRGWVETEARGRRAERGETSTGSTRMGTARGTDSPGRDRAAEPPRRSSGTTGNAPSRSADPPSRETPRSYSPPQRESTHPAREAPPRTMSTGGESRRSEPAARSSPPASAPAPQPVKGNPPSGGAAEKKPPPPE